MWKYYIYIYFKGKRGELGPSLQTFADCGRPDSDIARFHPVSKWLTPKQCTSTQTALILLKVDIRWIPMFHHVFPQCFTMFLPGWLQTSHLFRNKNIRGTTSSRFARFARSSPTWPRRRLGDSNAVKGDKKTWVFKGKSTGNHTFSHWKYQNHGAFL